MELIEEINQKLLTKGGHLNGIITRQSWFRLSDLYKRIIENTSFLPENTRFRERIFCIKNHIKSQPICPITGKPLKWLQNVRRYAYVSGLKNSPKIIDYRNNIRNENISNKHKQSNKDLKENIINCFNNNTYVLLSRQQVTDFINQRILEKGDKEGFNFIKNRHREKNVDLLCSILYYTDHPLLHPIPIEINWGERFYLYYHNITPPTKIGTEEKANYWCFSTGYTKLGKNSKSINAIQSLIPSVDQQGFEILNESFHKLRDTIFTIKCKKCGRIQEKELSNARWKDIYCPGCYGDMGYSKLEKEVVTFLDQNNIKSETNVRNIINGELDVYIPSKNLAIEFDGISWHSFGSTFPNNVDKEKQNKYKHLQKTEECKQKNIQLLHIWDSEWKEKSPIVKSIILSKLGIYKQRFYGRKCEIKIVDSKEKRQFINDNHLQGDCKSTYNLGLFYKNKLISVMTFGKRKITRGIPQLELLRFCSKLNTQIVGGASKLLQYFIKEYNPKEIISYADRRYSGGNLYKELGFIISHESLPNYWYMKNGTIKGHRSFFQKHKLPKLLGDSFDANITESENMYKAKFRKIYDCGNFIFKWSTKKLTIC